MTAQTVPAQPDGPAALVRRRRPSLGDPILTWAVRLRRVNGPNFTWPLMQFSGVVPEGWLERTGRVYRGRELPRRSREELLANIRPDWKDAIARAHGDGVGRARLVVLN